MDFAAQFINLTNTPIFSVPASWWGQYSSCASCNGVRTTGFNGGGSGTVGLFGSAGRLESWPRRSNSHSS